MAARLPYRVGFGRSERIGPQRFRRRFFLPRFFGCGHFGCSRFDHRSIGVVADGGDDDYRDSGDGQDQSDDSFSHGRSGF